MANKPVLIIGGICILLAIASFGVAWSSGARGVEEISNVDINEFIEGPNTSLSYTYTDEDGQGSGGWYVMMDGEYSDENGNDKTDACEDVTFTITDSRGNDVTGEAGHVICSHSYDWKDEWADPVENDGRIVFGYVCATIDSTEQVRYTCTIGEEYTIASETQLYVFDKDSHDLEYVDGGLALLGSGLMSMLGACCCGFGFILVLVGALTGGAPKPMVGYMPQQMGQMPIQQPQYTVGADIDSSRVADTPVSVEN